VRRMSPLVPPHPAIAIVQASAVKLRMRETLATCCGERGQHNNAKTAVSTAATGVRRV
jgi:hypothetical protein